MSSSDGSKQTLETAKQGNLSTNTEVVSMDTLHFEGLVIDITVTVDGYANITTQDMNCVGTRDRETYVAGFGSIPADDRASKLVQKLLDITSILPE